MRAVKFRTSGGPATLVVENVADATAAPGEVLIDIHAAGINRADVRQREGRSNAPPGTNDIFGMEVSGKVAALGDGANRFRVGDAVVALLASGGYADMVSVHEQLVLPLPAGVDIVDSAGLPEAAATVVSNVITVGQFLPRNIVLIHGASGGVGAFAIQLVVALGGQVAVTASTPEKLAFAAELGATILIDYRREDFAERMRSVGGADIILDTVGGPYLQRNVDALAPMGRIVTIGTQGGGAGNIDLMSLMKKKGALFGTLLRDRSVAEKAKILCRTHELVWPLLQSGAIWPTTDAVFPLSDVADAHRYFDSGQHRGKVLLDCRANT